MKQILILTISILQPFYIIAQDTTTTDTSGNLPPEAVIFLLCLLIYLIFKIYLFFHERKCPYCKGPLALNLINEEFLGTVKTKKQKLSNGTYATIHYNKIKKVKQCRLCGKKTFFTKIEKG
ncbi:MAG: hypothetical protein Q4B21_05475 [Bacteroidia bacterium]|nr:hypothetical protein [Bacteroidia bacterium]